MVVRGKFLKTRRRSFGYAWTSASTMGSSAPQKGHSKSPNSIIVPHASLGPRTGDVPTGTFAIGPCSDVDPSMGTAGAEVEEAEQAKIGRAQTIRKERRPSIVQ